jgi:hypothetical protein
MTKQTVYLSYTNLTPGLKNNHGSNSHQTIIKTLREHFFQWSGFFLKHGNDYSIGFYISTKKGTEKLNYFGPSISKKMKIVDYTMFIPDEIKNLENYLDTVFEGFEHFLTQYSIGSLEIEAMKNECKKELGL